MQRWVKIAHNVLVPEENIGSIQIEKKILEDATMYSVIILLKSGETFTPVTSRWGGECDKYFAAVERAIAECESVIINPYHYMA